jgi:hypothetical protein
MQTHQDLRTRARTLPLLQEGACLVCGTHVPASTARENPEEELHQLGWHSWVSRVAVTPSRIRASLLRLCPECVADPMFVATTILENHGPDEMEEWIMSMELKLGW